MKLNGTTKGSALKDAYIGVIIALVSIPISMGYAQVAGLPAAYGLYGSLLPILIFGLFSTSPQFIFGVDAAPAALVGAFLVSIGVSFGSDEAIRIVPALTFCVAAWLAIFRAFRAGRAVKYVSEPVMAGFISGISSTIILMQAPKLLGGSSGSGELAELVSHLVKVCRNDFSPASLITGGSALAILIIMKRIAPRFPASLLVMAAGAAIGYGGLAEKYGVARLSTIESGLPSLRLPEFELSELARLAAASLTIAAVITAETLLASGALANKNGYKLDADREVAVYSLGNLAACLAGCCPVNGSVSRSAMGEQYGARSQITSLSASISMAGILLFGTGFIKYLPVPVLTAIVISALLGAIEFEAIGKLWRTDRKELAIFFAAFFGVLIFGTVYGVAIGVFLSFVSVIIGTANPKRSFLGVVPGHEGFHSLERNSYAVPLKGAVVYRFSGNLYFANVGIFADDVEGAVKEDTKAAIVDSGAICSLDVTAAARIVSLDKKLAEKGVGLYFASHIGALNDAFRRMGLGSLVEEGRCRRTIPDALLAAGIKPPYETEGGVSGERALALGDRARLEFEWAFGGGAEERFESFAERFLESLEPSSDAESVLGEIAEAEPWRGANETDREELLEHMEARVREFAEKLNVEPALIEEAIERSKLELAGSIAKSDPQALAAVKERNRRFEEALREREPQAYDSLLARRREALESLRRKSPEFEETIGKLYEDSKEERTHGSCE